MTAYVAPGIYVEERDFSEYPAAVAATQAGLIGYSARGPVGVPTFISSIDQFIDTFGAPNGKGFGALTAVNYLKQARQLWYVRVARLYDKSAVVTAFGSPVSGVIQSVTLGTGSEISEGDYVEFFESGVATHRSEVQTVSGNTITLATGIPSSSTFTTACSIKYSQAVPGAGRSEAFLFSRTGTTVERLVHLIAKDPGEWANYKTGDGLSVTIEDGGNFAQLDPISGLPVTNDIGVPLQGVQPDIPSVDSLAELFALTSSGVRVGSRAGVNRMSRVFTVSEVADASGLQFKISGMVAATVISASDSISIHGIADYAGTYTVTSVTESGGNTLVKVTTGSPPASPILTNGVLEIDDGTRQSLVFRCSSVNGVGSVWTPVGVHTKKLTVKFQGRAVEVFDNLIGYDPSHPNYWDNAIAGSQYLTATYAGTGQQPINSQTTKHPANPKYAFGLGVTVLVDPTDPGSATSFVVAPGTNGSSPSSGDYVEGLQQFRKTSQYDITLLSVPGVYAAEVLEEVKSVATARHDCIGIIDPPFGLTLQQAVDWHNGQGAYAGDHDAFVGDFLACYWPWVQTYDPYTRGRVWVPPSVLVVPQYAYSDKLGGVHKAVAGLKRGSLIGALAVEHVLEDGDVEYMYGPGNGNALNPIRQFTRDGIVIDGQRTMQRFPSSLDRINVRRMVSQLEKVLATATRSLRFEQNDEILWAEIRGVARPILEAYMGDRAIEWYSLLCDSDNNTGLRRNQNQARCDINIIPTKAAEIIVLGFNLFPSGITVEEMTRIASA